MAAPPPHFLFGHLGRECPPDLFIPWEPNKHYPSWINPLGPEQTPLYEVVRLE